MTIKLERKKREQIQGRTNRRRPIFNPTMQLVVVNLYTKFEVSILNGCGDIFDKKSGEKEKKNNKASQAIQSPRTVPFFLLVSLLDGYSFPNVLVKGIVAFKH